LQAGVWTFFSLAQPLANAPQENAQASHSKKNTLQKEKPAVAISHAGFDAL